jgi:hypothetical protein
MWILHKYLKNINYKYNIMGGILKMMKIFTTIISFVILILLVSSVTALQNTTYQSITNKINEKTNQSLNNNIHQSIQTIQTTGITDIIGIFYIFAGVISLFYTILMFMMALIAITFNPMGFVVFIFSLVPAALTVIFLGGGFSLLLSNNPMTNLITILFLSSILFVIWIVLRLNGATFLDIFKGFIYYFIDYYPPLT